MDITVYDKPTCSTSRKAIKLLKEKGLSFNKINYYNEPFSKNKLKTLLKKAGLKPEDILRKREKAYKELDFKNNKYSQDKILDFMLNNPDLIERPIVQIDDIVILARPVEKLNDLLQ